MAKGTEDNKIKKEALKIAGETLKLLGYKLKPTVEIDDEAVKLKIEGDDLGLLIGQHGENLESLQLFLSVALNRKFDGLEKPFVVDIGGWRDQREEALRQMVERQVAKLSENMKEVSLPPMPPSQRRAVHILVGEQDPNLITESMGEEPNRYIVIRRKE